ncbi:hypothetical protein CEUSTIGMA_g4289.t1 [Chlamydomonas eustigma]|uniref:Uncharacterized protein n=1 Tax=Chlamydomonas eustigma TaxID=1157962 RepID=A0A250X181_9CHLO|nr:hypothetical protein CEUSTIGMA_g4289.t1 [Chlamydomonas eustigma]|eukprot:GAX76843.1 hypothetical protein CEUSTIGMA_g4289.t1 [Chlamydomonas eustigma]
MTPVSFQLSYGHSLSRGIFQRPTIQPNLSCKSCVTTSSLELSSYTIGAGINSTKPMPSHRSRENASFRSFNIRAQAGTRVGLFPAGQKQITVQLPALMLEVEASSLMISQGSCSTEVMGSVGEAVSAGVTAVILREGSGGAAELLEAAFSLKELLRSRAALLLVDRTDIATAAEADGVLLTDQGLPTVVAKRMMQMRGESVLVGRIVTSVEAAVAAAADGASLVLISDQHGLPSTEEILRAACSSQRSGNAIPVISYTSSHLATREQLEATWPATAASSRNGAGSGSSMDGLAVPLSLLQVAAISAYPGSKNDAALSGSVTKSVDSVLRRLSGRPSKQEEEEEAAARAQRAPFDLMASSTVQTADGTMVSSIGSTVAGNAIRRLMSVNREALITEEKAALNRILKYLEEVVPQMDELQLLRDSLKQLDDLFLVVVVGEFNSGKSSVINALLGKKYLAEGILPTTNEISILS